MLDPIRLKSPDEAQESPLFISAVSFASEGHPHDAGLPIGRETLEAYGKMCIEGGASTFTGHTPRTLIESGHEWAVQRYSDEHLMDPNPGYHLVGLGAWRILILKQALDEIDDTNVVVVHCSNFIKYPKFQCFARSIRKYVQAILRFTDFYMPMHCTNAWLTRGDLFERFIEEKSQDKVAQAPVGQARLIVVEANRRTRCFVDNLLSIVERSPLVLSPYGQTGYKDMQFWRHCAEQSLINIIAYRDGIFPVEWESSWIGPLRFVTDDPDSGGERIIKLLEEGKIPLRE